MKRMTKTQALAEAVRRFGTRACVRDDGRTYATTPEQRAEANRLLVIHRANKPADYQVTPVTERGAFNTLSPDAQQRRLARFKRDKEWRAELDRLMHLAMRRRYHVGEIMQILSAFHVRGSGDTWRDAFDDVDRKAARDAELMAERTKQVRRGKKDV